jgi:hypothetical protein
MRLLLTTIILTMLAQPVWAGVQYSCGKSEGFYFAPPQFQKERGSLLGEQFFQHYEKDGINDIKTYALRVQGDVVTLKLQTPYGEVWMSPAGLRDQKHRITYSGKDWWVASDRLGTGSVYFMNNGLTYIQLMAGGAHRVEIRTFFCTETEFTK